MFHRPRSRLGIVPLAVILMLGIAGAGSAQEPDFSHPTDEPSSSATLMDRSDLGNTVSQSRMAHAAGMRDLKRAEKLEKKLASADDAKRAEIEARIQAARESAVENFTNAIRTTPGLLEAYGGLGRALGSLGRHQESLQVYAVALQKDPSDNDNFRGWAEELLELDLLGNATQAYGHFQSANPEQAEILLAVIRDWLDRRRQDPGELAAEDIEKMADWLAANG